MANVLQASSGIHLALSGSAAPGLAVDRPGARTARPRWTPLLLGTVSAAILGAILLFWQQSRPAARTNRQDPSEREPAGTRSQGPSASRSDRPSIPPAAIAPFDEAKARGASGRLGPVSGLPVEYTNPVGMAFRLIPPGEFRMGFPADEPQCAAEDRPRHPVVLTAPFYLGTTEVTRRQFQRFVEATGYRTVAETNGKGSFFNGKPRLDLTWRDVSGFHPVEPGDRHAVTCLARRG